MTPAPLPWTKMKHTEIAVPGDEDSTLLLGHPKQFKIRGPGHSELRCRHDIMSQAAQKSDRHGIDILVGQEPHGVGARRISSTATTSMAYWMHAQMSSGSSSE